LSCQLISSIGRSVRARSSLDILWIDSLPSPIYRIRARTQHHGMLPASQRGNGMLRSNDYATILSRLAFAPHPRQMDHRTSGLVER
jgi:hypothetical protein